MKIFLIKIVVNNLYIASLDLQGKYIYKAKIARFFRNLNYQEFIDELLLMSEYYDFHGMARLNSKMV